MERASEHDYLQYFATELAGAAPDTDRHAAAWSALAVGVAICLNKYGELLAERMNATINAYRKVGALAANKTWPQEEIACDQQEWHDYLKDVMQGGAELYLGIDKMCALYMLELNIRLPELYDNEDYR